MSQSSNKPLVIGLGASDLALGEYPGWLPTWYRPAPITPTSQVYMSEDEHFTEQGALNALREALWADAEEREHARHKQAAYVVLDDFWANHAILSGDFRTLPAREVEEIVKAYFNDTFDLEGQSLEIRFEIQPGGRTLFTSAMSSWLHEGILEVSASANVAVKSLRLCLPEMLNRTRHAVDGTPAMLVFVTAPLLQAVMVEHDNWVAYDSLRLFPGDTDDAWRLAALTEQLFERSATTRREDCTVYLYGASIDPEPFESRFACVLPMPLPMPAQENGSTAPRLMEYAR
ncbi:hypothetical protein [Vogesella sp. LIG4]|uniref:hypothetical protein n=1 Tax=Vogesella sp. LIG4 TaxID=1192162 RepID=UPI0008200AD5|nr:hypothetical protein [Vogesella sp. LIG4]SCK24618.1 hypothetical protein PSELUDRAFT_2899 [Vogesella sp. LIG4]